MALTERVAKATLLCPGVNRKEHPGYCHLSNLALTWRTNSSKSVANMNTNTIDINAIAQAMQLMQMMQGLQQPQQVQPAPQVKQTGFRITGAITQFENSECKIGDVKLREVPDDVEWTVERTKDGHEFIRSKLEYQATAHIGEHGRVWATDVACLGTVAEFKRGGSSFQDRLAKLRGTTTAPAVSSADDDNQPL